MQNIKKVLEKYSYPGRGIVAGLNQTGDEVFVAYFIMGRSLNSKNRFFELDENNNLKTKPIKKEEVKNKDLIIYTAVTRFKEKLIVSNGNHTDTILKGLKEGKNFKDCLNETFFENDPPILTPRISLVLTLNQTLSYCFSIVKSCCKNQNSVSRFFFEYFAVLKGTGHLIHTYKPKENNQLNSFFGEPTHVLIPKSLKEFKELIWSGLNSKNKISLFVSSINLVTKKQHCEIINENLK